MKRPSLASRKRVSVANLVPLGAERLAALLIAIADARPELKRRLRMELAAELGPDPLAEEVDKRLLSLATLRSKVSWRQRATFLRELEALRLLIADRLAALDRPMALERMWRFMGVARHVGHRVRDGDGELAALFDRAAADLGRLIGEGDPERAATALVEAIVEDPGGWTNWLPLVFGPHSAPLAAATLRRMREREAATPAWTNLLRALADAAGDVDTFRDTYSEAALRAPHTAAEVAQRLLAAGRVEEAGRLLEAAEQGAQSKWVAGRRAPSGPDFAWESASIDYLERSGQADAAQAARWASFERTLSVERARDFTGRLPDFEDVEAEHRAFDHAAAHADTQRGLAFLMDWPALPEAARMIEARAEELRIPADQAELWAARLRPRQPKAAYILLRRAAATAFQRREFATCDRLTAEAESIGVA